MCNILFNAGLSRVVFAAYNNLDRWLQPRDTNQSSGQPLTNTGSPYRVRSRVVSASINEPSGHSGSMKKLEEPVEFVLQHNNVSDQLFTALMTLCPRCAAVKVRCHFYGFAVTRIRTKLHISSVIAQHIYSHMYRQKKTLPAVFSVTAIYFLMLYRFFF